VSLLAPKEPLGVCDSDFGVGSTTRCPVPANTLA
jgi:hypothetical protein